MAYPGLVPTGRPTGDLRVLMEAFQKFREGLLYFFIAMIVAVISIFGAFLGGMAGPLAMGATFLIILVIALAIGIMGLLRLKDSGEKFAMYDPSLGKLRTAVNLYIAAFVLMILGSLLMGAGSLAGWAIVLLGGLLSLAGAIFFGLHLMSLGDLAAHGVPVPEGFRTDGILYLIGIIIGILQLVALILAYLHAGEAIQRLAAAQTSPQATSPQPGF